MPSARHLVAAAAVAAVLSGTAGAAFADEAERDSPDLLPRDAIHLDDASVPDPARTPGDFDERAKAADLCDADSEKRSSAPTSALCDAAFASRGIGEDHRYEYACGFLVPAAIGGVATKRNVWLQPASEAHWKRALDDEILKRVCKNGLAVSQAQREIAGDWVGAYRRYILPSDRLIEPAHTAYDPKDDPGRSRTIRGITQDQAVAPADVPQTGGQNNQPIEASVMPGLGQGGSQSGGGLGGSQASRSTQQRGGGLQPPGPRTRGVGPERRSAATGHGFGR